MERQVALTTIDNEYNPIDQFDEWFKRDEELGYHSLCYLARITNNDRTLSSVQEDEDLERAIDEIVRLDPFGVYIKFVQEK